MFKKFIQLVYPSAILFMLLPQGLFAAELIFSTVPNTKDDNTITIEARIDPQSKILNVVEGEIKFYGSAAEGLDVQVKNGESILPIWTNAPVYDADEKRISFTGGVPNGFDTEGLLFFLTLSSIGSGDLNISYTGDAYLNDGKGTKEIVSSKIFKIGVGDERDASIKEKSNLLQYKYVIIILLFVAVLVFIYKYGFKKNVKK